MGRSPPPCLLQDSEPEAKKNLATIAPAMAWPLQGRIAMLKLAGQWCGSIFCLFLSSSPSAKARAHCKPVLYRLAAARRSVDCMKKALDRMAQCLSRCKAFLLVELCFRFLCLCFPVFFVLFFWQFCRKEQPA